MPGPLESHNQLVLLEEQARINLRRTERELTVSVRLFALSVSRIFHFFSQNRFELFQEPFGIANRCDPSGWCE
jgi:hypothetical protein